MALSGIGDLGGETVRLARLVATEAGTRHLLGGILRKKNNDILLDGFLFDAESGAFYSVPPISFDRDLLTAGISAREFVSSILPEIKSRCSGVPGKDETKKFSAGVPLTALAPEDSLSAAESSFPLLVKKAASESEKKTAQESSHLRTPQQSAGRSTPRRPVDSRSASGTLRSRDR